MEPFQLVCQSCAAKLKVKNRSAIGQRLACPRCREMILVQAPEGHDIGETSAGMGGFDEMDMDSILENRPAKKPQPKKAPPTQATSRRQQVPAPQRPRQQQTQRPRQQQTQRPRQQQTQRPQQGSVATPPSPAPGDQWVNPATKKKQRLVLMVMAAIGSLLVLAAVVISVISFMGKGDDEIVADGGDNGADVVRPDELVNTPEPEKKNDAEKPIEKESALDSADPLVAETPSELVSDAPPDIGGPPSIAGVPDSPPGIPGTEPMNSEKKVEGFGDAAVAEKETPTIPPEDEVENREAGSEEKLRSILAESGTSLLEIQGAASVVRNELAVGTPKYFFEKLQFDPTDATKQKDQILLGVNYDKQPLQTVLHELSAISGLVLTIDVPALAAAGLEFNPPITLTVENQSTAAVVREVAKLAGLTAVETDNGFWVTAVQDLELRAHSVDVAALVEGPGEAEELIRVIRQVVYPGSWKPDVVDANVAADHKGEGTISFVDGKLEIRNLSAVHKEILQLIDGIKAAAGGNLEGSPLLQPVDWIDAGDFTKAFEGKNAIRVPVAKFLQRLGSETGVNLIADWRSLSGSAWTPDAMAPSWMQERTIGDVVRETAHGLGVSIYVADEKTAWLTTPEVSSNIFVLKLYPVGNLAGGRLNTQRLNRIMFDSLGAQLNQPGVLMSLLPKQKLALVRAPQSLQRQIRAVFTAIK